LARWPVGWLDPLFAIVALVTWVIGWLDGCLVGCFVGWSFGLMVD